MFLNLARLGLRQGGYENCAPNGNFGGIDPSHRMVVPMFFFEGRESEGASI
jgi:hypothetical protein